MNEQHRDAWTSDLEPTLIERLRLEEQFRLVVESAPAAMVMVDDGIIVFANPATALMFG